MKKSQQRNRGRRRLKKARIDQGRLQVLWKMRRSGEPDAKK
ncbi:MAG TPA: hypothetical protein VN681_01510 [Stellaceae bacterium]|nr:hypothetical protein [Stellaceae bacterium]